MNQPISRLFHLISRYGFLTVLLLTLSVASAWADNETATYPGDSLNSMINVGMGSYSNALAPNDASNNNRVTVGNTSSTTAPDFVFGGYNTSGASTRNTVTLNSGATVTSSVFGGFATNGGSATGNTVILNSGATARDVSGGWTEGAGSASGNTVILNPGATVNVDVIGGMLSSNVGITADNNTVIFHSGATVGGNVYGGSKFGVTPIGAGNTLELRGAGQSIGGDLAGFQNFNFYLPSTLANGGTMLTVTGTATITGATVNVGIDGGSSALGVGDTVTLINAGTLTGTAANTTSNGQGMQGISLLYEFDLTTDVNSLYARVSKVGINPQTHALLSGRSAQTALLTQGADLVAGKGLQSLKASAKGGHQSFMAVQGGSNRYKTGSGIDIDSFSFMAGAAWGTRLGADTDLALGAFVEIGNGSYNSSNSFTGLSSVRGSGDTNFAGAGVIGSLEWANGFYADASFKGGRVKSDFSSSLYVGGERASFDDTSSLYLGAHAGAGYNWAMTSTDTLDMYTRYLWTYTDSDSVKVLGDKYYFDSANSHRWRTGMKYGRMIGGVTPYAGIAYEFEFDGKAGGSVHGYKLKETDMGGSTWIGELGIRWIPKSHENVSLDLALEGFAGQRDGFSGNFRFNCRF